MSDAPRELAIIGPGLIGTSIALAAKRRWPDLRIITVDKGQALSAISEASMVVLAMPISVILDTIPLLPALVAQGALVMDTGSTKQAVMEAAAKAGLPHFVGGHPMAGGTSLADARAELFDDAPWFLTSPDAPADIDRASAFVGGLGARPIVLDDQGQQHDRLMAAISHLPQVTASALMAVVSRAVAPDRLQLAGNGLRDTTRLAASPSATWESILATNSRELKPLVKALAAELSALADRLDDPSAVRRLFDEANRARSSLK